MTPIEALTLLDNLEFDPLAESRINPSFSRGQTHKIVRDGIASIREGPRGSRPLDHIMETRVYQALRNQRKPRF